MGALLSSSVYHLAGSPFHFTLILLCMFKKRIYQSCTPVTQNWLA